MKKKITCFLTCFFIILILFSCNQADDFIIELEEDYKDQEIIFQFERRNYAWGRVHEGWFINGRGEVKGYQLPDQWHETDSHNFIDTNLMFQNYSRADTTYFTISPERVFKFRKLIDNIKNGELSEKKPVGADMGSATYYAYYKEAHWSYYKRIVLHSYGDWTFRNQHPFAPLVTLWLNNVNSKIDDF